jgi:hypothetical protein
VRLVDSGENRGQNPFGARENSCLMLKFYICICRICKMQCVIRRVEKGLLKFAGDECVLLSNLFKVFY